MRGLLVAAMGLVLGGVLETSAADIPFGADGLPYLARRSSLVVEVAEAEAGPTAGTAALLYRVKPRRVLRGTPAALASLLVLAPRVAEARAPKELVGGLLFLSGPLSDQDERQRGLARRDEPVYELVGGRSGAIPASDAGARATAREYVALQDPAARLTWAVERVTDPDPFVQRSALLELAEPGRGAADEAVVGRLLESLRSDRVRSDNKGVAVQLLERTQSPRASAGLAELAKRPTTPPNLRREAVRALSSVPGGEVHLREFRDGTDPVLAPAARRALELKQPGGPERPRPDAVGKYRQQLASPDERTRREGALALGRLEYSADSVKELRSSALSRNETSAAVRLAAIESLSRFSRTDSAEALKEVAMEEGLPKPVRAAAVMGIAKMESGVGLEALRQLAASVRDPEIKRLATGLADQP